MSEFYSLALGYAPSSCTNMRAAIYSNRSMAYVNQQKIEEAKADARHCITLRNTWFRVSNVILSQAYNLDSLLAAVISFGHASRNPP